MKLKLCVSETTRTRCASHSRHLGVKFTPEKPESVQEIIAASLRHDERNASLLAFSGVQARQIDELTEEARAGSDQAERRGGPRGARHQGGTRRTPSRSRRPRPRPHVPRPLAGGARAGDRGGSRRPPPPRRSRSPRWRCPCAKRSRWSSCSTPSSAARRRPATAASSPSRAAAPTPSPTTSSRSTPPSTRCARARRGPPGARLRRPRRLPRAAAAAAARPHLDLADAQGPRGRPPEATPRQGRPLALSAARARPGRGWCVVISENS